jgi:hypothetical protein
VKEKCGVLLKLVHKKKGKQGFKLHLNNLKAFSNGWRMPFKK